MQIQTPAASRPFGPGQYVVLQTTEEEPEIQAYVLKADAEKSSLVVMAQLPTNATEKSNLPGIGERIARLEGPCGHSVKIANYGSVLCLGHGSGIVPLLTVIQALAKSGNYITTILYATTLEEIVLDDEIRAVSDELIFLTDNPEEKHQLLQRIELLRKNNKFGHLIAFGPASTVKESNIAAIKYHIQAQTFLHLTRTGKRKLSGTFKVSVCDNAQSICVDGHNFNAFYPNFDELIRRFASNMPTEKQAAQTANEVAVHA